MSDMSDIPIIFSAPMVLALLAGRKTMTRRLAWRKEEFAIEVASEHLEDYELRNIDCQEIGPSNWRIRHPSPWQKVKPGVRLYVREAHAYPNDQVTIYRANWQEDARARGLDNIPATDAGIKWRPSIHLPRADSRLTLVVTATKIENLQDISEADAKAEGVERCFRNGDTLQYHYSPLGNYAVGFEAIWNEINGADAWDRNPEVVALTFTVHKANIDRLSDRGMGGLEQ